ncbi:LysR family transcriptional regulator [Microbacterium sp. CFBP9023]|uniref:LysR family transcriptional regulator n=1 Tax=Microbacterium sp. CFBP9023 TaxID=3096535 RepID=UPI002A6AB7C3|nr:LysR family transcriptional regulator [Microbacterium sp. CFBP9023]MDY0985301.1 LysR family transcriptional regulator [Microbacterium sp. CFBP9023]
MPRRSSGITLQQLQYFIEVAAEGSITAAADVLYVAQPTMSAAMKDLESRVGRDLLTRSARGVTLTSDGTEFLGYARQIVEQAELLEQRYLGRPPSRRLLGVSTQHYSFAVDAFVRMVKRSSAAEYEFSLRETRTWDIIEDVRTLRSELGILFRNDFNRNVIDKLLRDSGLAFHPLFIAEPHIFVSRRNALASRDRATLDDLVGLPRLTFDQGANNSFYFAEEILSTLSSAREIRVSDRATIFNLMIGLDGYTISTGIISDDLDPEIVAVPLDVDERIEIGWIGRTAIPLTEQAQQYLGEVRDVVSSFGVPLLEDEPREPEIRQTVP